jgi:hypothetical protein
MSLDDIAATTGTTTTRQCERGVATVDETGSGLATQLESLAGELPCDAQAAATLLRTHSTGRPIGESAALAGLPPVTAVKTLHRLGVDSVCPLAPTARRIVRDYLHGNIPRMDAVTLTGASRAEFALASYIETHDPLPGAREVTAGETHLDGDAMVAKRDRLRDSLGDTAGLR